MPLVLGQEARDRAVVPCSNASGPTSRAERRLVHRDDLQDELGDQVRVTRTDVRAPVHPRDTPTVATYYRRTGATVMDEPAQSGAYRPARGR